MSSASQQAVEEWRRGCEDHLVRRAHYSHAAVVIADQLHIGKRWVFSELTKSHFGILFKAIVSKMEYSAVHIEARLVCSETQHTDLPTKGSLLNNI